MKIYNLVFVILALLCSLTYEIKTKKSKTNIRAQTKLQTRGNSDYDGPCTVDQDCIYPLVCKWEFINNRWTGLCKVYEAYLH